MKKSKAKKLIFVVAAVFLLLSIVYIHGAVVPTIKEGKNFGADKQGKITYIGAKLNEKRGHAVYNGEKYSYEDGISIYYIGHFGGDSGHFDDGLASVNLLSWNYNFMFYGTERYWAYSEKSPDFLVHQSLTGQAVYFNESFDFKNQPFYTDKIIGQLYLSDMYIDDTPIDLFRNHPRETEFYLYCSSHPELRIQVQIKPYNSEYYITFDYGKTSYKISENFLNVLKENKII